MCFLLKFKIKIAVLFYFFGACIYFVYDVHTEMSSWCDGDDDWDDDAIQPCQYKCVVTVCMEQGDCSLPSFRS